MIIVALSGVLVCCGAPSNGISDRTRETPGAQTSEANLEPASLDTRELLRVVATSNILGDVVWNVGGDKIDLTVLMGIGVDPHTYVPTSSDTAAIHDAHLVFASGAGLETNLDEMLANAGGDAAHIEVSNGLELLPTILRDDHTAGQKDGSGDEQAHGAGDVDPHVWFDVRNVIQWVQEIEQTLKALDPGNAAAYEGNAREYTIQLEDLDAWIGEQVLTIPEANRLLVTNHPVMGYLAERYGLEQLGAVYPLNPASEPSAQEIAALEDTIHQYGVPAVFTESTVNPRLAEQVAKDTGIRLVPLYTGSLGGPGSGAETYILMMQYDVRAIVDALR